MEFLGKIFEKTTCKKIKPYVDKIYRTIQIGKNSASKYESNKQKPSRH